MSIDPGTAEAINRVQRDAYESGMTVGKQQWTSQAAEWHRQQAFNWDGLAASSASVPSDSECKLMAEIHRYMAERIEGDERAKQLYERVLLFPVNP